MTTRLRVLLLACASGVGTRARGQRARSVHTVARDPAPAGRLRERPSATTVRVAVPRDDDAFARGADLRAGRLHGDAEPGGRRAGRNGKCPDPGPRADRRRRPPGRGDDDRRRPERARPPDEHHQHRDDRAALHRHGDAHRDLAREPAGGRSDARRPDRRRRGGGAGLGVRVVRAHVLPAEPEHPGYSRRSAVRGEARCRAAQPGRRSSPRRPRAATYRWHVLATPWPARARLRTPPARSRVRARSSFRPGSTTSAPCRGAVVSPSAAAWSRGARASRSVRFGCASAIARSSRGRTPAALSRSRRGDGPARG